MRSTTPYHPQGDGMAERNIGLVKQVIRCLLTDRKLSKGSWPGVLTEVSFHINSMDNATTRLSTHLFHFGREPASSLYLWCSNLGVSERKCQGEYLETLRMKRLELREIAIENSKRNLAEARRRYNANKKESDLGKGDRVMLRRSAIQDSLSPSPRFSGPFEVLEIKGPDVKLQLRRMNKWVHLDNVTKYIALDTPIPSSSISRNPQPYTEPQGSTDLQEGEQKQRTNPALTQKSRAKTARIWRQGGIIPRVSGDHPNTLRTSAAGTRVQRDQRVGPNQTRKPLVRRGSDVMSLGRCSKHY